jgi:hypothetical protein
MRGTDPLGVGPSIIYPAILLSYGALSVALFGRNLIGHWSDRYIGMGFDPGVLIFFFQWWHHAIANHLNPFKLSVVWAPGGSNLAWAAPTPLAALPLLPLTATYGPIVAYNVAILLCPPLSAFTAFILCRKITHSFWPSLVGGYIFGFSPFMSSHILGHLMLTMVFLLPLTVYLVILWFGNELSNVRLVCFLGLALTAQLLSSLEILATMTGAGIVFLALLWLFCSSSRKQLLALLPLLAASYLTAAILTSPYLYYFFAPPSLTFSGSWSEIVSASPTSLIIPLTNNIFGEWKVFRTAGLAPNLWETSEYIGLPLLLLLWNLGRRRWNESTIRMLLVFAILIAVATFGPALHIGSASVPLPWKAIMPLPLVRMILPARLAVYMFLALSVAVALWLSDETIDVRWRAAAAAFVAISLLPNLNSSYWTTTDNTPQFFKNGIYRRYLPSGANVLILPYARMGDSDIWQASTDFYFTMPEGYVAISPPVPASFVKYPIVSSLYNLVNIPDQDEQFKAFLVQKKVQYIIVADESGQWQPVPDSKVYRLERNPFTATDKQVIQSLIGGLDSAPLKVGGITLYRVPLDDLQKYAALSPDLLERRVAVTRITMLIRAASEYASSGQSLNRLNPLRVEQLGLLPPLWVGGDYLFGRWRYLSDQDGLVLGYYPGGIIAVGLFGERSVLLELAAAFNGYAESPVGSFDSATHVGRAILLPPGVLTENLAESMQWLLILEFQPEGLARAAAAANDIAARELAQ